jgi:hypothetical protein
MVALSARSAGCLELGAQGLFYSVGCRVWVHQEKGFTVLLLVAIAGTDIYYKAKMMFVVEGGSGLLPRAGFLQLWTAPPQLC